MKPRSATGLGVLVLVAALPLGCRGDNPAFRGAVDARNTATDARAAAADLRPEPDPVDGQSPDGAGLDAGKDIAPATTDLARGLVGYWKLDDAPGSSIIQDSSGQQNHGTAEGIRASDWVPGRAGTGLRFGVTTPTPGVRIPPSPSLDVTATVSVSAWALATSAGDAWRAVISRQLGSGAGDQFGVAAIGDRLHFVVMVTLMPGETPHPVYQFPVGVWVHVAGTYDGAVKRLYINGKEVASTRAAVAIPTERNPLYLGTNKNGAAGESVHPWVGILDELAMWNRALSPAEVAAVHAGGALVP